MDSPISRLSANELARLIRRREVSALEVAECCLDEIERHEPDLRAFITVGRAHLRDEAEKVDRETKEGAFRGSLHGVPVAVKDNLLTEGMRTTFGSRLYANNVATRDDIAVARVKAAGGIVIGKTNLPEFGCGALCVNGLYGPTANPYNYAYTSGGSSGGSAVAVAAGMVPVALGTDFGGSLRTPASFCGVIGLRSTPGRVPTGSGLPWTNMNVHGAITRSVDDAITMLEVLSGPDESDPNSIATSAWRRDEVLDCSRSGLRIGYSADLNVSQVDYEVREIFSTAIGKMEALGFKMMAGAPDCFDAVESFEKLRAGILYHNYGKTCAEHADVLSPSVVWNVLRGKNLSATEILAAESLRARARKKFYRYFDNCDVLATVSASVPPFPNTQEDVVEIDGVAMTNIIDYLKVTYVVSLVGFPALSIPFGFSKSGLPVGIQLIAKPFHEGTLLRLAQVLERNGFKHVWPDLLSGSFANEMPGAGS